MGRHRRPGPSDQPPQQKSQTPAPVDPADPLAAYERRRQPPIEGARRHRPLHGGGSHLHPDQPRILELWDGFTYQPAGTAPTLAAARAWLHDGGEAR